MDILIIPKESIIVNVMKNKTAFFTTKWIAYTAMLTALVVATMFIPPVVTPAGRIYWVDGVVLLAAYLVDPLAAFIVGGMGTFIYDFFYSQSMMFASLLIHGFQGAIVSALLRFVFGKRFKKYEWVKAVIFSLIAAVEVVLGYFAYRCIVSGVPTAVASIPRNIIQEVIGITLATVICYATTFKKQLEKNHLLPDFRREILDERKKQTDTPEPPPEEPTEKQEEQ